jgi:hypothetical protein
MAFDIYGNDLQNGHCEVHPWVAIEYPCPVCIENNRKQNQERIQAQIDPEEKIHNDLKEIAHYYGGRPEGWKKLREVIDMLEDNENEAVFERHFSRD